MASASLPPLREILTGRRLLLTGATGFLGKVVLARLLCEAPELARVACVVRAHDPDDAHRRFARETLRSRVFDPVRAQHGSDAVESRLDGRLAPFAGDLAAPSLGLDLAALESTEGPFDAVVNCAGLVDFEATLESAWRANVLGPRHALETAKRLRSAFFLHVSTCYVAGRSDGVQAEEAAVDWTPRGTPGFSAEREAREIGELVAAIHAEAGRQDVEALCREEARRTLARESRPQTPENLDEELDEAKRRWLRRRLRAEGLERAERLGWPNTYTYTKSLGEQWIAAHATGLPYTIVRPSVIESALRFPFPGWNQGVNTSAPLLYLAQRGFRHWPVDGELVLDVVPVDWVADALVVALAAGLHDAGQSPRVVHVGTGARNPLPMRRLVELSALWLRDDSARLGRTGALSRWLGGPNDPVVTSDARYRLTSPPAWGRLAGALAPALEAAVEGRRDASAPTASRAIRAAAGALRGVEEAGALVERMMRIYRPYVAELHYIFQCHAAAKLTERLVPADREHLGYAPETLDWRRYWIDVHLPGLTRWSFPELERRRRREARRPASLGAWLRRACERAPRAPLVRGPDGRAQATRGEVLSRAEKAAAALAGRGVAIGEPVPLALEPNAELAVQLLAIVLHGAVPSVGDVEGPASAASLSEGPTPALLLDGEPIGFERLQEWLSRAEALGVTRGDRVLSVLDPAAPHTRVATLVTGWLLPWLRGATVVVDPQARGALRVRTLRAARPTLALAPAPAWEGLHRAVSEAVRGSPGSGLGELRDGLLDAARRRGGVALPRGWVNPEADARLGALRRGIVLGGAPTQNLARRWSALGVGISEALAVDAAGGIVALDPRARGELTALSDVRLLLEDARAAESAASRTGRLAVAVPECARVLDTPWLAERLPEARSRDRVRLLGEATNRYVDPSRGLAFDPERAERRYPPVRGLLLELACAPVTAEDGSAALGALAALDPAVEDPEAAYGRLRAHVEAVAQTAPAEERVSHVVVSRTSLPRRLDGCLDRATIAHRLAGPPPARHVARRVRRRAREIEALPIPSDLARLGRRAVGDAIERIYRHGFQVDVSGRAFVPVDRPVLVATNHASHLDAGLVRHAMGTAGRHLCVLGARDYFFGPPVRRTFFEHLTDVVPFDREGPDALGSLREAVALLRSGRSVLVFPEGSRSPTGAIRAFQPGVGFVALRSGADVLPAYIDGTYEALPRGARWPRARALRVRFGATIPAEEMRDLAAATARRREQNVAVAARVEAAVRALRDEELRSAGRDPERLRRAVLGLRERLRPGEAPAERTWYFSLGSSPDAKWTVRLHERRVEVLSGRPSAPADCVLVAPPETFLRMLTEGHVPPVSDFVAGRVKTNRPDLLREFQRAFGL